VLAMAMLPSTFSLSALAVELDLAMRTVASALRSVPADALDDRGRPQWKLKTAMLALGYRRGRGDGADGGETSYRTAKAALANEQARRARIARLAAEEKLLPAEDVARTWTEIFSAVRTRLLAIPTRVVPRLMRTKTAPEMHSVLQKEIH